MQNLLLIWSEQATTRYFVLVEYEVSEVAWKLLKKLSGKHLSDTNSDVEHKNLWKIKAAVSNEDTWVPASARAWLGTFNEFEKELPITRSISTVVVIGKR